MRRSLLQGLPLFGRCYHAQASNAVLRVDLRSDTLTLPSRAMREAMAKAEVGDDVFAEDPTVNGMTFRGS